MPEVDLRRRRRPSLLRRILTTTLVVLGAAGGTGLLWWRLGEPMPRSLQAWIDHSVPGIASVAAVTAQDVGGPAGDVDAVAADPPSFGMAETTESAVQPNETHTRPIRWWLAAIARRAGRGLVVDPAVRGEVTADFGGNDWKQSLEAFARTVGFSYSIDDGFIEVKLGDEGSEAKSASVGTLTAAADGRCDAAEAARERAEAAVKAKPVMELLRLSGRRSPELAQTLAAAVRVLGVRADADPGTGALLLTGLPEAVAHAKSIIARLDVSRRSVVLEAQIIELSKKARDELGIQWSLGGRVGLDVDFPAADTVGEAAALLLATAGRHAVHARLAALEADGLVRVVSRPRVVVMEGRPASIESVRVLRIRLPNRTALVDGESGLSAVSGSRAVEEIPVGVSLDVSPTVLGDGRIVLAIKAKSSTLGPPQPPDGIPEEFSRLVEAEVVVANGETAVLGGLMRQGTSDSGSGVPGLRSIPLLGRLFGRRRKEVESEELLFLVTPTLVRNSPAPEPPAVTVPRPRGS